MNNGCACMFQYTSDNANMALEEIKLQLEKTGCVVTSIDIVNEDRACRNAYGKEVSEEEFGSYEPDSDEAWFDDYDFLIKAEFFHPEIEDEEILFDLIDANVDNFLRTEEEYLEEYELGD